VKNGSQPRGQLAAARRKPEDLDPAESARWEQHCAELDRGLEEGNEARTRRALAMLDRLRYGSH
jgi:hypothetical protein